MNIEKMIEELPNLTFEEGQAIFSVLGEIERLKPKDKIAYLKKVSNDDVLKYIAVIFKLTYDPDINFGVTGVSVKIDSGSNVSTISRELFEDIYKVIVTNGSSAKEKILGIIYARYNQSCIALANLIIKRDLRIGIGRSTVLMVFPNLWEKFAVMLAKPFNASKVKKWPVFIEPKLDGMRVVCVVTFTDTIGPVKTINSIDFYTRSGKCVSSMGKVVSEVSTLAKIILSWDESLNSIAFDGEATSGTFLDSISGLRKKDQDDENVVFNIFDILKSLNKTSPLSDSDDEISTFNGSCESRRSLLARAMTRLEASLDQVKHVAMTKHYVASSAEEVQRYYLNMRNAGFEGVMVKNPNAGYEKSRSIEWMKVKGEETDDVKVVGAEEGTGKYEGMLGALIVQTGDVTTNVGSGFTDAQRADFWSAWKQDLIKNEDGRDNFEIFNSTVEVEYQERMPSGALRHPRFVRLRHDKDPVAEGSF